MVQQILLSLLFFVAGPAWCAVHLNSATASEIANELVGIGERKAEAIVQYRKAHGRFRSLQALDAVKGIGPKILEKNKDRIVLD